MKHFLISLTFFIVAITSVTAQETKKKDSKAFKFFNRAEISYTFGLNETLPNEKINAFHIKTVLGFTLPKVGLGFGLENATFRSANGGSGANFNTIAFSANAHVLAKDIKDEGINFFLKGGIGYAPKIFRNFNKGLTYEGAAGLIITNKRGSKYFLQGIYHHQNIDDFFLSTGKFEVKSFGVGIGTWL
jgi:hypothetical protein